MIDASRLKLGRKPPRIDTRTLKLASYLKAGELPVPPAKVDNAAGITTFGMLKNDVLGDCTCAGIFHAIMIWGAADGFYQDLAHADAAVVQLYSQLCGYVPGRPETDQGGIEIDILNAWRKQPIMGCELGAYVAVDPKNWLHVKTALWLFGTLYMGIALPLSAQDEEVWSSTRDVPGGWGGHCVVASGYADRANCLDTDTLTCITWGQRKTMTRSWLAKYCDELYAPLSPTWLGPYDKAPNGFNLAQLKADLALI